MGVSKDISHYWGNGHIRRKDSGVNFGQKFGKKYLQNNFLNTV